MKKTLILILTLVFVLAFTLTACNNEPDVDGDNDNQVLAGNPCDTDCPRHPENGNCHCHGHCGIDGCECHTSH